MAQNTTGRASAPNRTPLLLQRLIADCFDLALIFLLFLLLTALLLKTPLANAYYAHEAKAAALVHAGEDAADSYQNERFAANLHSYLLKSTACLAAEAAVLLAVPLCRRDRATPGKMMCALMPFGEKRQSRASRSQIVLRFLFVFFLDSLLLYLVTGVASFPLVALLRLTELLLNRNRQKTLCDWITGIRIIEKPSYDGLSEIVPRRVKS